MRSETSRCKPLLRRRLVQARVRQAALLILLLAVLKIFLWDMSDLDGLYRAASFLGLGACLVGLGWFYQHYVMPRQQAVESDEVPGGSQQ